MDFYYLISFEFDSLISDLLLYDHAILGFSEVRELSLWYLLIFHPSIVFTHHCRSNGHTSKQINTTFYSTTVSFIIAALPCPAHMLLLNDTRVNRIER